MTAHPGLKDDPCTVCRGTGKAYLEHPDGSLSEQVCPYCKGSKNAVWRHQEWQHQRNIATAQRIVPRVVLLAGWLCLLAVPSVRSSTELLVFWGLGVAGLLTSIFSKPKAPKVRRPNPLTTDTEVLLGTALVAGVAIKGHHDAKVRRQQAQMDQIVAQQQQIQQRLDRGF